MRTHSNSLTVARTSRLVATSHLVAAAALLSLAGLAQAQNAAPAPAAAPAAAPAPAAAAMEYAVLRTTKGDIVIELDRAKAPITVENFVGYIKDGFFDGTVFHRIVPGFVIQGGGFDTKGVQKKNKAPIDNEWQNGLKNKRGTLSMARTDDPKSATSQFFISLKDNDMLDQPISGGAGYAVFGNVLAGMEVVDAIAREPRGVKNGMKDWPNADVVMTKVEMLSKEDADKMVAAAKAAAPAAPVAPKAPVAPAAPAAPAKPQ
jgi:peptidyl-prolyl cis-trans isomerase B (cyclophilin B)